MVSLIERIFNKIGGCVSGKKRCTSGYGFDICERSIESANIIYHGNSRDMRVKYAGHTKNR